MAPARLSGGVVVSAVEARPSAADIWRWLDDVPDPEIPGLSVNDLGIVRAVDVEAGETVVTVTPTYSGCPATAVIAASIAEALRRKGVDCVRIKTQISPAWTTDWISPAGREKLKAFGIAPPEGGSCAGAAVRNAPKACPRCGSGHVEEVSRFGSTPCKASWRCADCLEPFDYFKRF